MYIVFVFGGVFFSYSKLPIFIEAVGWE